MTNPIDAMDDIEFLDWVAFLASKREHKDEGVTLTAANIDRLVMLGRSHIAPRPGHTIFTYPMAQSFDSEAEMYEAIVGRPSAVFKRPA